MPKLAAQAKWAWHRLTKRHGGDQQRCQFCFQATGTLFHQCCDCPALDAQLHRLFGGGPQVAGVAIGNCVSSLGHPCRDQIKSDASAEDVVKKPDTEFFFFFSEGCHFSANVQDISTIRAESCFRITLPFIDADVFSPT